MVQELKPYDLVRVQEAEYAYTGQIISRPFEELGARVVMVRRVPGDPATMEKMELKKLSPAGFKPKYVQYGEVQGQFSFPVDMLRYDHAAPVNFRLEKDEMGRTIVVRDNPDHATLIVGRAVQCKNDPWTHARWHSFSWVMFPLSHATKLIVKGE